MTNMIVNKLKNKLNVADILTELLTKYEVDQTIDVLQHEFTDGRNADVPGLSILSEGNFKQDNELHVILDIGISQRYWCMGKVRSR